MAVVADFGVARGFADEGRAQRGEPSQFPFADAGRAIIRIFLGATSRMSGCFLRRQRLRSVATPSRGLADDVRSVRHDLARVMFCASAGGGSGLSFSPSLAFLHSQNP